MDSACGGEGEEYEEAVRHPPPRGGVRRTGDGTDQKLFLHLSVQFPPPEVGGWGEETTTRNKTQMNYNFYNKNLREFARKNRKQMTMAEACLWKYALKAKLTGYTFNRQRPVLNYIADFMCKELKLIIEVDGNIHLLEDVAAKDIIRQTHLEEAGFKVIRFKNEEVLNSMIGVRRAIRETIDELTKRA